MHQSHPRKPAKTPSGEQRWTCRSATPINSGLPEVRASKSVKSSPSRAKLLDQYYTREDVAKVLVMIVLMFFPAALYRFLEPSAGSGAFLKWLPDDTIAYDKDRKAAGIIARDYLKSSIRHRGKIVVIGNPPFGKQSKLAKAFFNYAASYAVAIAFIVPRTFQKDSIKIKLDDHFHLIFEMTMPKYSFIFEGRPKDVPTVFQIWERRSYPREIVSKPTTHKDFDFVKSWEEPDFAIQRVGSAAGRIHTNFNLDENSHHFIKANVPGVRDRLASIDFASIAARTAGNPSVSKAEIVEAYISRL